MLVPIIYDTMPPEYEENLKFQDSMMAMMSLGVGEVLGGIIMGWVVDKFGTKLSCFVNIVNIFLASTLVIFYLYVDTYSWLAYLMTFVWGWQDSCISIHIDTILGFEFESTKEPFSIDSFIESLTVFTFQMVQSLIS